MKARRLVLLVTLALVAALLVTTPVAAGGGVIPFRGHMTSIESLGAGTPTALPGGRTLVTGAGLKICYVADEVDPDHDYLTGCWFCEYSAIIEPSGAQRVWGACPRQELTNLQGVGGWVHQFQGEWTPGFPPKTISLHATGQGWGVLEGWRLQWREFAVNYDEYEVDWGHFTPPR